MHQVLRKGREVVNYDQLQHEVLTDVHLERLRQNRKWGIQRHDQGTWLMILAEEFGEVAQAMQKAKGWGKPTDASDLYTELIHLSAVAVAIAEQIKEEGAAIEIGNHTQIKKI
ncbi:MazG-like family protein [Caldibacillus lycopersici]|uniref:MazG-like family protein n=1 Tax=Perspicuibacillus lycopersici TaxID=1325689 RepID=A0AAE3IY08_9BACI|nr:MazG-like family protein [Perspicuibacillus lycopersici]MCU9614115.1 MazG-like family protein [Perspicuibacillus lycopersici]